VTSYPFNLLTLITQDLKLPVSTLSTLVRETGCRIIKSKTSSETGEGHLMADLTLPLKFPKRMGAGKSKSR
jgi:glycine cleavage system regulatory protein